MKVVVYTAKEFEYASLTAAGIDARVFTCPPLSDTKDGLLELLDALQDAELILFNLHGFPGGAAWFGRKEGPPVALREPQLKGLDLSNAVVFLENCYAGDEGNPMHEALKSTKPRAIIAGGGINYGGRSIMRGADWLFWSVRIAMELLPLANIEALVDRARKFFELIPTPAAQDTAAFTVWTPDKETEVI